MPEQQEVNESTNPWIRTEIRNGIKIEGLEVCVGLGEAPHPPTKTDRGYCPLCGMVAMTMSNTDEPDTDGQES